MDNETLVRDLVEWLAGGPRPYGEVMDAWRTSCPRLTIWEDAVDHGLVARVRLDGDAHVTITPAGRAWLQRLAEAEGRVAVGDEKERVGLDA